LDLAKSLGYKTEDIIINSYMGQPTIQWVFNLLYKL
jgi:hypothetical protein